MPLNSFDDDDSQLDGFSSRAADLERAKLCIEEALDLLAQMGAGADIDQLTILLNRSYQLLDRCYGSESYESGEELNFNEED